MSIEKLDFQKVTKENLPYTLVLTKVIQNIKHKDALAVWVYLCSLPPDWSINKEHLKKHFHIGDRTLQAIFSYLNRTNLIAYKRERFDDGTLGIVVVHVLCGDLFKFDEPYIAATPQKTQAVDARTTPQKTTRVVNHTSGSEALQKKHNNKENKKITNKSFCEKRKEQNKRHDWADMKNESAHIKANEKHKRVLPPPELKGVIADIKNKIVLKRK